MASSSVCNSCLRTLRQQLRQQLHHQQTLRPVQQHSAIRTVSSATRLRADEKKATRNAKPSGSSQPPPTLPLPKNLASTLRNSPVLRGTTEPYIAYGSTEDLFRACAAQCSYTVPSVMQKPAQPPPKNAAGEDVGEGEGWWLTPRAQGGLELDVTFNSWAQVMMLHMYMLTVRLRCFPREHAGIWHQSLLDHFFYAAEDRMAVWHGMAARGIRNRYLKDLWLQWRGLLLSYDEGLIKGDAVLATAVWRNLFKASDDVDVRDVALVTAYVRRELARLGELDDEVLSEGRVKFGSPESVRSLLDKQSTWMHKSFTAEDAKGLEDARS
ncbi:hypothetical protein BAUCODRAFT_31111 [Baudoinia panamericana UAMH 10762]|uniref:Ubiquinol-cytochrome c chaperone domain-containing protein n=1 Tax=Baudoinia panamericana (strain UAMH 10762) TaxID=717646 RepID=M2NHL2_BAUPA|nr:uncharacterized protein BAUCODRAFT_31111 [Baudoinia panamericana UAMH 10762]EMC98844.1 hypothetical protein BAUCODRAFT_31111 [Baudoinia panamericana UAMH 10762]